MSDVALNEVRKVYGDHVAVDRVDLTVTRGEFVTLLGPSGCGKTTCLRMIAGFVTPTSGQVSIGGRDVTYLPPHRRSTGMVFQSYALFPHHTVAGNVAFGLKVRGVSRVERDKRTIDALKLVHLADLADRYPSQLSGGQRQRVALARAVVINPDVLLLDEPLGALDLKLREELQTEIKRVQSALDMTTLFVTHDQGEALSMSTRVAVMRDGKIVQIGSPKEIYERPNGRYVANFVGRINLTSVIVEEREGDARYRVKLASAASDQSCVSFHVAGPHAGTFNAGDACMLAVRPEHVHFQGNSNANKAVVEVSHVTYLGNICQIEGKNSNSEAWTILARPGESIPESGTKAQAYWQPEKCFLLKPN
jgi:putative spermidine/putrescine transport system ATP-binding protein